MKMPWKIRRERKKKPVTWLGVLNKKKQILLSMEVARVLDEYGRISDKELLRRNGTDVGMRWERVEDILDYSNCSHQPHSWAKIIAEFAKPFVPGLTKAIAPEIRGKYVAEKRKEITENYRIDRMIADTLTKFAPLS